VEALAAARVAPGAREAVNSYDDAGAGGVGPRAGIDVVRGHGRLAGPGTVDVERVAPADQRPPSAPARR